LNWPAVDNADEYGVYYEIWRRPSSGAYERVGTTTQTSYTDSDLPLGSYFYYKIRACSIYSCIACGDLSGEITVYVTCSPQPPANVSAEKDGDNVKVSWDVVNGATEYKVYRSTSKTGSYTYLGDSNSNEYTDITVGPPESGSVTYYYKVKTCIDCGCGELSEPSNGVTFSSE
jgi:fibronectin type 3 domain-containing protein